MSKKKSEHPLGGLFIIFLLLMLSALLVWKNSRTALHQNLIWLREDVTPLTTKELPYKMQCEK